MSAESKSDADLALVKRHVEELGEHFDAIQIFASRYEPALEDGTVNVQMGTGNWFARYGHVRDWLIKEEEATRLKVRKDEDQTE